MKVKAHNNIILRLILKMEVLNSPKLESITQIILQLGTVIMIQHFCKTVLFIYADDAFQYLGSQLF